ncbi:MAG: pyridoxal-phosphate dependent enzyme [Acidimicrobiia bacterium]|nr:pyridoxal-phosphate dependent enzyme [Acidimicrobiia bacterium]
MAPLDIAAIRQARIRIARYVRRTPLERSTTLSRLLGTNIYLKYELFQTSGSFKPRGAFNTMLALSDAERAAGVVGVSGGNFAQGMAYAGQVLGVDTLVLMPETTPGNYIAATRGYGAAIEFEPSIDTLFAAAERKAAQGRTLMHPFDHLDMMAGNGTVGLEIIEDVPNITDVFVSVGGGGLLSGVLTAVKGLRPDARVWAVETAGADVLARSIAAGEQIRMTPISRAKTLGSPYAAATAIELANQLAAPPIVVSDREAYFAMRTIIERAKVVPELAASCTLAAAETVADRFGPDDHVVLLLCGGNVSPADIAAMENEFG